MTENSAILEMNKNLPLQETRQETLFPLQPRPGRNAAARQRSDAVFYYMNAAPED